MTRSRSGFIPASVLAKERRRAEFYKDRMHAVAAERDRWRGCPVPGCSKRSYRYSSQSRLWQHLVNEHGLCR